MEYKAHKSFVTSKIWMVLTIFVFAISYIIVQVLYTYAEEKPDFDMKSLTVSYVIPIALATFSLCLFHFQKHRLGGLVSALVGVNLITNIAFTNIIINSTETLMKLFEPIFSILPLLDANFGNMQFNFLVNVVNVIQVLYGIFLIIINIPVIFKNDRSVFNHI